MTAEDFLKIYEAVVKTTNIKGLIAIMVVGAFILGRVDPQTAAIVLAFYFGSESG